MRRGELLEVLPVEAVPRGGWAVQGYVYSSHPYRVNGVRLQVEVLDDEGRVLSDDEALRGYNSHSSDHLIEARCNGETGYGVIEYLIRRGYGKYAEAHRPRGPR